MGEHRYHVVLNANAGTANATGVTKAGLQAIFEANGLQAEIDADPSQPMTDRVARAVSSAADIVVAAGGDGTITALAAALVDSPKSLAILPLGTVNALAKDLKVPLDLAMAVKSLVTATPQSIDVGEVNGRVFLHKVVIGLIPAVAAGRERIRSNQTMAAKLGLLRYFLRRIARTRRLAVVIDTDMSDAKAERVQAIAVASNAYNEGFGQFFHRENLDRGTLTLYVLKHFTFADLVRLTGGMLLGRWRDDEALRVESITKATIRSHKALLKVMFDGEVETMHTPLEFRIRPLALSVLTPVEVGTPVAPELTGATP
ncbi:diacylglycerol kinase family enzyme [Devosia sp. UYZn731]|uniref:diacylglycerol/lipid kinase family protein n=1 Tax=Devosia sp. UYZn731 TaxID=3156345 RepID=UPI003393B655